ncbi:hypothetical protein, partial [Bacillus sp. 71mf]|uniref:hypothetical protein n=1 Tax=Bacillus sp. 71mf TaxID=1761757 RepID=UPI0034A480F7
IISPHQSGFYGQFISHLTSLLSLNFEVGVLLPKNRGIKKERAANTHTYRLNKGNSKTEFSVFLI